MKDKKWMVLLITNIILIGIICNILNKDKILVNEKQILKEMTTSEREQELEDRVDELNTSATEYATYVQACKTQIAEAITNKGVETSSDSTLEVMAENIQKISSAKFFIDEISINGQWEDKQSTGLFIFDSTEFSEISFDIFAGYNDAYVTLYASTDGTDYTELQTWSESATAATFNIADYVKVKFFLYEEPAGGWGGCSVTNITIQ